MVPPEVSAAEIAAVTELLRESSDLSSSHLFANAAGAGRHHLSPARSNLLRHLELDGLSILELSGGCGGLSRLLAERAARFAGVEHRPAHRAALAERLRDLHGVRVVAEAESLDGESFDLVVVVEDPGGETAGEIAARLAAAKGKLRPGGLIALAGGNRLSLGAFAGQPDRRSRTYFEGLAGGDQAGDPLSRREWRRLCADLGLGIEAEYLVSPDVWLPTCVLREELLERDLELASDLICHLPFGDGALPAFPLLPPSLLAESLARGGLLAELAPGFLWLLGGPESRSLLASLSGDAGASEPTLAWHYAAERLPSTRTRFFLREGRLWVAKVAVTAAPPRPHVRWNASQEQPVLRGQRWRQRLIRTAYFEQGNFEQQLASLLGQLRQPFAAGPESLEGRALDAIFHNAIFCDDGETRLFDLEWELAGELPTSWWVLRNVLALAPNLETIGRGIGAENLGQLYRRLCAALGVSARLDQDLAAEAELQAELGGQLAPALAPALASSATPPRHPEDLGGWQDKQERLRGELETLRAGFASVARMADDLRWLGDKVGELAVSQDQQQVALRSQHESLVQIDGALRYLAGKIVDRP
jgi:hypothetical protein